MEREEAVEWLGATEQARHRTRTASRRAWFPLLVFGAVILGAIPFYREAAVSGESSMSYVGAFFVRHAERLSLYWVLTGTSGYVVSALFMRWRDRQTGVVIRWRPFVAAGLALFVVLVLVSPAGLSLFGLPANISPWFRVGDLFIRGLTPILTIALGLLVLAISERSRALTGFTALFVGVALLVNLYDIGNVTDRLGLGQHGLQANIVASGTVLVLGGIGFGLLAWRKV